LKEFIFSISANLTVMEALFDFLHGVKETLTKLNHEHLSAGTRTQQYLDIYEFLTFINNVQYE